MEEKDNLQRYLESVCHVHAWAKKQIVKKTELVRVINKMSISSVKKKL